MTSRTTLIGFLVFLAFAIALQMHGGAYHVDFSGNPDEPAHYVSGVMVRDYLAAFPWQAPMPFARDFYSHYPIVAIGHWPPMFYAVQAMWTLPFGVSRLSVVLLIAVLSGATATVVFASWRRRFGAAAAGALALALLSVPIVQEYGRMVMAEMLVALFTMLAVAAYSKYLHTEDWRDSLRFALAASAAILTKPNGLALALVPILAVIAARRVNLWQRFSYWLPAIVVVLVCAPWYVLTADLAREGWSASYEPSWLLREPAVDNAWHLIRIAGAPVFVLALMGMAYELWPGRREPVNPDSAVMAALLCSVWLFHSFIVPVRDARHLIPAIPALIGLSAIALAALAGAI
ncbi:MAG: glycosyltransferase family 39 protein, partial [Vicinamibacterales bacterium]